MGVVLVVLVILICALVLAVIVQLWPDRDPYRYRPAYEGMHILEQLVLQVLRNARASGKPGVHVAEISRRCSIDSKSITSGILERLARKKRVERVGARGPWRIKIPSALHAETGSSRGTTTSSSRRRTSTRQRCLPIEP